MLLPQDAYLNQVGDVTVPTHAQVIIRGVLTMSGGGARPHINTFDFKRATDLGAGDVAATLAENFWDIVGANYLAAVADTLTVTSVEAKFLDNPLAIPGAYAVGSPGTVTTDRQPSFDAVVLRKRTDVPKQNFRGSIHVGGVPESFTTSDSLNATGTAVWDDLRGAFLGIITTGVSAGVNAFAPVVLSRTLSRLDLTPAVFTGAPISSFTYNLKVGSMNRRKKAIAS